MTKDILAVEFSYRNDASLQEDFKSAIYEQYIAGLRNSLQETARVTGRMLSKLIEIAKAYYPRPADLDVIAPDCDVKTPTPAEDRTRKELYKNLLWFTTDHFSVFPDPVEYFNFVINGFVTTHGGGAALRSQLCDELDRQRPEYSGLFKKAFQVSGVIPIVAKVSNQVVGLLYALDAYIEHYGYAYCYQAFDLSDRYKELVRDVEYIMINTYNEFAQNGFSEWCHYYAFSIFAESDPDYAGMWAARFVHSNNMSKLYHGHVSPAVQATIAADAEALLVGYMTKEKDVIERVRMKWLEVRDERSTNDN